MAGWSFTFRLNQDASHAFIKARQAVVERGGQMSGSEDQGIFMGNSPLGVIEGTYRAEGRNVTVKITKKPFAIPKSKIQREVSRFFGV